MTGCAPAGLAQPDAALKQQIEATKNRRRDISAMASSQRLTPEHPHGAQKKRVNTAPSQPPRPSSRTASDAGRFQTPPEQDPTGDCLRETSGVGQSRS